jgi:hypothetical protein
MLNITTLNIRKKRTVSMKVSMLLIAGMMILCASIASAEPSARNVGTTAVDPKRSYGAIDVIMYQTSW